MHRIQPIQNKRRNVTDDEIMTPWYHMEAVRPKLETEEEETETET